MVDALPSSQTSLTKEENTLMESLSDLQAEDVVQNNLNLYDRYMANGKVFSQVCSMHAVVFFTY